ncbi:MAG: nuclear transport factor 2 family protein [Endozoicomonas sp.]
MSDIQAIESLIQEYFRSLYEGDVETVRALYHPACPLMCPTSEGVMTMTIPQYLEVVAGRLAPKEAGHAPYGRIVSLDISGPETALVKVESAVPPRYFEDYLTLVKDQGAWKIAAKVYRIVREE